MTLVSYGVLPQSELATVNQPSMASVLESIVGPWGSVFIRVGVVLSVLGAYLAWTLMAAEILYYPGQIRRTCRVSWPGPTTMVRR